jgi:TetR/AcrR family transcriptional repressor of bet genes
MPGRKASPSTRRQQILEAAARVAVHHRLAGLTIRDVAREAGLSTGLILFHFKTKASLTDALLDWLLDSAAVLEANMPAPDGAPRAHLFGAFVRSEARRLASDRLRTELFFDFWVAGTRTARLRVQIRRALMRYRQQFRALAVDLLKENGGRPTPAAADALAAAAVSFVQGCAIQALIDPQHFKLSATLTALDALQPTFAAGGGRKTVNTRARSAKRPKV